MEKKVIVPPGIDPSTMPYSPGVQAGNTLFASGALGVRDGALVGNDIVSQARQAMENLGAVLAAAGTSWDRVVKVNCYLVHPDRDFAGWNEVFREYFAENPPARTTVGATLPLAGALIEVDITAIV
ncbi:MAG TPA: RidA family protein [Chloroflexi bacterium]|jgi:2-iminobutanoate/2-iminopropanoate deaminase|nr:RidA family protein [Chloroflexota bacterium]